MGTGFVATTKLSPDIKPTILPSGNVLLSPQLSQPDLLTDHNSSINGKKSTQTTTTSIASEASNGSYRAAMESIIHDYKLVSYFTFFKCVAISDTLVRRIGIDMGIVKKSNAKKENVKIKLEKSFKVNGRFSLLFKNVNALQN